jgi:hypothetical protein
MRIQKVMCPMCKNLIFAVDTEFTLPPMFLDPGCVSLGVGRGMGKTAYAMICSCGAIHIVLV